MMGAKLVMSRRGFCAQWWGLQADKCVDVGANVVIRMPIEPMNE